MIVNDYAYLQSGPIDTSAESTLTLSFRSMINNYAGGYNCSVKIRATDADPWIDITPWTNPIWDSKPAAQYSIDVTAYKGTATSVMFEFSGYYYNLNFWYLDDFSLGTYSTDFSGTFPPQTYSLIPEYNSTVLVDIAEGAAMNVTLPEWTPADMPFADIDYQIDASVSMNVTDGNPIDNEQIKLITLSYIHDVGVTEINIEPYEPGGPGTYFPVCIVKNFGVIFSENNIPVNAKITHIDNSTVIYDQDITVLGPLVPSETTQVTFPDFNTSGWVGRYRFEIKTELPGDDHPENDKKTLTIDIPPPPPPPETIHNLSGIMGNNGWYVSDVIITLTPYYGPPPLKSGPKPPGYNHTYYKLHAADNWTEYFGPVTVSVSGYYELYYFSVDNAGNAETPKGPFAFKIDNVPPVFINFTATPEDLLKTTWFLNASVDDATSGVAKVEFYIDGASVWNVFAPGPYTFEYNGSGNVAQAAASDMAGNVGWSNIVQDLGLSVSSQPMLTRQVFLSVQQRNLQ